MDWIHQAQYKYQWRQWKFGCRKMSKWATGCNEGLEIIALVSSCYEATRCHQIDSFNSALCHCLSEISLYVRQALIRQPTEETTRVFDEKFLSIERHFLHGDACSHHLLKTTQLLSSGDVTTYVTNVRMMKSERCSGHSLHFVFP
jgi:hypothetical protein